MPTPTDEAHARALILDAFRAARDSGKPGWTSMTVAVLKNRLLQLTARSFDQGAIGFERFTDLLDSMPDLVDVDRTTQPASVRLVGDIDASLDLSPDDVRPATRIRKDLWHSIVDYSAGHAWVWDAQAGVARRGDAEDDLPLLPTISEAEMAAMRERFVDDNQESDEHLDSADRLHRWAAEGLGSFVLPSELRREWNAVVKTEVVHRLSAFFEAQKTSVPSDALQHAAPRAPRSRADEELASLRSVVIDCVRSMTLSELSALNLPAGAVLRSQGRRPKGSR